MGPESNKVSPRALTVSRDFQGYSWGRREAGGLQGLSVKRWSCEFTNPREPDFAGQIREQRPPQVIHRGAPQALSTWM